MSTEVAITEPEVLRRRIKTGWVVAAVIAVLTIIEYMIAVNLENPLLLLLPFVVAKGLLILDYFMHIRKLWGGGDH